MPNTELAKRLTDTLKSTFSPKLFNPWRDRCCDCMPCGEAPSHRGCRHSGIAFTSECQLLDGMIPRISQMNHRLTSEANPYFEHSAKIVWDELYELRIEKRTILWNALPMHPHEEGKPQSNRTPTSDEIEKGKLALQMLVDAFPSAIVVAVGRKAEGLLKRIRMKVPATYVRHPARGGERKFRQGLKKLVKASLRELRSSSVCSIGPCAGS